MCMFLYFFFFKQKTAYEMRISDWSSDVCSSDLQRLVVAITEQSPDPLGADAHRLRFDVVQHRFQSCYAIGGLQAHQHRQPDGLELWAAAAVEIGRASCRERVCTSV